MIRLSHMMQLIAGMLAIILVIAGCSVGQPATPPVTPGASRDPGTALPVIFDDDGSQDGTAALAYLLSHPDVSIKAITISYGEAHPDVYVQHIGRKLDELGIEGIPLGAGQDAPLAGTNAFPDWLRWVGVGMAALSIPLAYWATRALGNNVTRTVVTRENHELITSGPYRWVRHPLYSVGILFFTGLILIAANWFMMVLVLLTFPMLIIRLPKEEEMLIERFGDAYREYQRRTGRLLPRLIR